LATIGFLPIRRLNWVGRTSRNEIQVQNQGMIVWEGCLKRESRLRQVQQLYILMIRTQWEGVKVEMVIFLGESAFGNFDSIAGHNSPDERKYSDEFNT
jgi:hypothetical protein